LKSKLKIAKKANFESCLILAKNSKGSAFCCAQNNFFTLHGLEQKQNAGDGLDASTTKTL
jgi:hypothetical protein